MAKIKSPAPSKVESPAQEGVQAPDLSSLIAGLNAEVANLIGGENAAKEARLNMVVSLREAREEHGEALGRDDLRLAIQTAVAEGYGLKLTEVQNKPDKAGPTASKDARDKAAKRNSCYTLVSELLSMSWGKDEKQDAKVAAEIAKGENRWVVLRALAQKKQNRPEQDPDKNKVTKDNFAAKLSFWFDKAATDMGCTRDEALEMGTVAIEAMNAAPKA